MFFNHQELYNRNARNDVAFTLRTTTWMNVWVVLMQSTEQDSGSRVESSMPNLRQKEVRINSKHLGHSLGILGSKSVERKHDTQRQTTPVFQKQRKQSALEIYPAFCWIPHDKYLRKKCNWFLRASFSFTTISLRDSEEITLLAIFWSSSVLE